MKNTENDTLNIIRRFVCGGTFLMRTQKKPTNDRTNEKTIDILRVCVSQVKILRIAYLKFDEKRSNLIEDYDRCLKAF